MGALPSTPRWGGEWSQDTAEYLIGTFVGVKTFPLSSDYWQKLLELPFDLHWAVYRVQQACETFDCQITNPTGSHSNLTYPMWHRNG
ncbi:hypothetical protein L1987_70984 [Smallanthus sonchifolius]|uniref:Uncharacterized protein n=1 Tax=Smallanthus sonchifolius TaxID=185202 RepID=A0ACB9ASS0_9ASTR|nr:hypothetical protein L1987_70984 [Smallanthus sonchifolius]